MDIYSKLKALLAITLIFLISCESEIEEKHFQKEYVEHYTVQAGQAESIMFTAFSTTLLADGQDKTRLRIAIVDSLNHIILNREDTVSIFADSDVILEDSSGTRLEFQIDSSGNKFIHRKLKSGMTYLNLIAPKDTGKLVIEARSADLNPGSHEIHFIDPHFEYKEPPVNELQVTGKKIPKMIGADISFLPQIQNERGWKCYENGKEIDPVKLLKSHGMNAIRLRLFVEPENEKGYSPEKGYCGIDSSISMARRIKAEDMYFVLDFHYSDYWADPQKQYKPERWRGLDFETLCDSVYQYTKNTLERLSNEGVSPDMVQIGNEINHGIIWPEGHIGNPDQLAALLRAGSSAVREFNPDIPVMMHIALGGQHEESIFWLENMLARDVDFDIIGISYYPRWHGSLDDLNTNLIDLAYRFNKPINIVEYSDFKKEVHEIVFELPNDMGNGAFIWEPLNSQSGLFKKSGESTPLINVYDTLSEKYLNEH